jgi:hypothetical protein
LLVEGRQGLFESLAADLHQGRQAAHGVGHVGGGVEVAGGARRLIACGLAASRSRQALRRARVPAPAASGENSPIALQAAMQATQFRSPSAGEAVRRASRATWIAAGSAGSTARVRSPSLGRDSSRALKAGSDGLSTRASAQGVGVALLADLVGRAGGAGEDQVARQGLAGFPAIEQVGSPANRT